MNRASEVCGDFGWDSSNANNTLGTNQGMKPGESRQNNAGTARLTLQQDGNLTLIRTSDGALLWQSGTSGKGGTWLWMEWTGNLRLEGPGGKSHTVWSNGKDGHKDSFLRIESNGNMYVWDGSNHQIWDAGASLDNPNQNPGGGGASHTDFGGVDKFIKEAAGTISDVTKIIGPIAAIVVNIIPGVGQVASVAIAGAMAALGSVTNAIKNGGKGILSSVLGTIAQNIPGGNDPNVQAALSGAANAVEGAVAGRPIQEVINTAMSGLPIDPNIKATLSNVISAVGSGVHVDSPDISGMIKSLPANVQGAIKIGFMAGNKSIVGMQPSPNTAMLNSLAHIGVTREGVDQVAAHGRTLAGSGTIGFDIGVGAMISHMDANKLNGIRVLLSDNDKKGFDMALALHIGQPQSSGPMPHPVATAAKRITLGMTALPTNARVAVMQNMAVNPNARPGAVAAIKQVAAARETFLHKVIRVVTLGLVK